MRRKSILPNFFLSIFKPYNLIVLFLVISAALVLAWVGWLIWNDITVWSKDLGTILFGSRTGENISLGIGMTVFYYFSIGMLLLAAGMTMFLGKRIFIAKPKQEFPMKSQKTDLNQKNIKVNRDSEVKSHIKEENAAAREERIFSGCLHHFGYLSSRPKDSPIPQECIICQRLGDCMVATVYVKKIDG